MISPSSHRIAVLLLLLSLISVTACVTEDQEFLTADYASMHAVAPPAAASDNASTQVVSVEWCDDEDPEPGSAEGGIVGYMDQALLKAERVYHATHILKPQFVFRRRPLHFFFVHCMALNGLAALVL